MVNNYEGSGGGELISVKLDMEGRGGGAGGLQLHNTAPTPLWKIKEVWVNISHMSKVRRGR